MKTLHAFGAYGRKPNLTDIWNGKDFQIVNGPYFSRRDLDRLQKNGYTEINFYKTPMDYAWGEVDCQVTLD